MGCAPLARRPACALARSSPGRDNDPELNDNGMALFRHASRQSRGGVMSERSIDELGPVDYLVVEFPAGQQNFTGEAAEKLLRLHDSGTIRVMDLVIIGKGDDGTIMAQELGDLDDMGEFARLETELAETLAEEDVLAFGETMENGSLGAVLVYENLWAAGFASAVRHAGGQLITQGRIPVQAIIAAVEADEAAYIAEGV
jgi:hypothetical protein